jgi:hypothetical protein
MDWHKQTLNYFMNTRIRPEHKIKPGFYFTVRSEAVLRSAIVLGPASERPVVDIRKLGRSLYTSSEILAWIASKRSIAWTDFEIEDEVMQCVVTAPTQPTCMFIRLRNLPTIEVCTIKITPLPYPAPGKVSGSDTE